MTKLPAWSCIALLFAAAFPASVSAQTGPGAIRLSVDGSVLWTAHENLRVDRDGSGSSNTARGANGWALGAARTTASLATMVGKRALVGTRLSFSSTSGQTTFGILPYGELLLSPSDAVRVSFDAGLGMAKSTVEERLRETTVHGVLFEGGVGLRLFVADGVSVDPGLVFHYRTGSKRIGARDLDYEATSLVVVLGLSGWLGGEAAAGPAEPAR